MPYPRFKSSLFRHLQAVFVLSCFCTATLPAAGNPDPGAVLDLVDVAHYYVAPDGDDSASGLTKDEPKQTLEAVLTAIQRRKGYEWLNPWQGNPTRSFPPVWMITGAESYGSELLGPVIIWMRGGVYRLEKPVEITFADSHPLIIASYPGEEAILDGSRVIEGWEERTVDGNRAWVAEIPEVAAGDWFFRQLFVAGERARRATLPETGYFMVKDSLGGLENRFANQFKPYPEDFQEFHNIQNVEVSVMHYWINHRLVIDNFDPETGIVTTVNRTTRPFIEAHPLHGFGNARYRLENVREGLREPGQWYLDGQSGELIYLPKPGQTFDNTEISAPHLESLVRIRGNLARERLVENVRFVDLTFRNTAVDIFAHNGTHNNAVNSGPGVVSMEAARNCAVEDSRFHNIGGYGVELLYGCSLITVAGNRFEDMGCGAVKMNSDWLARATPPVRRSWLNRITDNTILRGGRHYHGSPAIVVNKPVGVIVAHNRIHDFFYNGIALGGGPLNQFSGLETRIENNHISKIGQGELSDMGAIYVHGTAGGVVVKGNVAYDVEAIVYGGSVLYLDAAAAHIVVEDNLFYRGSSHVINAKGRENIIRNNILAFGDSGVIRRAEFAPGPMNTIVAMKNIMLTDGAPVFRSMPETHVLHVGGFTNEGNLIYDVGGEDLFVGRPQHHRQPDIRFSFEEWKKVTGNDRLSIVTDPLMRDPVNGDFTFTSEEAAERIGFEMPDFSNIGPRSRAERKADAAPTPTRRFEDHHE